MALSPAEDVVRFGLFELDLKTGQLTRNGYRLRLPQQSLQVLTILLGRPGEIVNREELRRRLWSPDVFVDFDHGLNKSVQKLRDTLGDSAESPRYIETIPRIGYRFIAPLQDSPHQAKQASQKSLPKEEVTPAITPAASTQKGVHRRWVLPAAIVVILGLAIGAVAYRYQASRAAGPIHSVAVLPLENLSGDPGQEYLADGITDELITMLAKNTTLRVVSRTSVMQYKGAHRPLRNIAHELGVDGILEGSVSRNNGGVRMTLQLIRADTDSHLWAESYDRSTNELAALPGEAARDVAKRLHSSVPIAVSARYVNPEAHDAYLRGSYFWGIGQDEEAGRCFRRAVQLQPDYAPGWAGLAEHYGGGAFMGVLDPLVALPKAEASGQKAVELDSQLAEAHLVFGAAILFNRWDWPRALEEISRAIELDPKYVQAYHMRALTFAILGRDDEAVATQKQGTAIDPFYHPAAMAEIYLWTRHYDAAIADARMRTSRAPEILWILSESYRCKGMSKEAAETLAEMFTEENDSQSAASIRRAYQAGGYKAVVHWQLEQLEKKADPSSAYRSPVKLAKLHAQLGERETTLSLLEQALKDHSPLLLLIRSDPAYDFLHTDQRYRSLIQKIGLPAVDEASARSTASFPSQ